MRVCRAVAAGAVALVIVACHQPAGTRASHRDEQSFPSAAGKLVVLDLRSLDAEIQVVEEGAIVVEVELEAHSSSRAAARRWVERQAPEMDDSPTRLEVSVPRRRSVSVIGYLNTRGAVRVRIPAECRLEVRTASGDVELRGTARLGGPVRIDTSSGDVTVRGGAAELLLDSESGDVRVTGAALAILEAETASGDVTLDAGAERVVVETSSGEVVLHDLRGDLSTITRSGDVDARWSVCGAGRKVNVETGSGDVVLRLAATAPVTGEVRTSSGSIESELDGSEDRRGRRFIFAGPAGGAEAGPLAGGVVELSVRTSSGSVTLIKVDPVV